MTPYVETNTLMPLSKQSILDPPHPRLSVHVEDGDGFRTLRLQSVLDAILAEISLLPERKRIYFKGALRSLHDHKWCLEVVWWDRGRLIMFAPIFRQAWSQHQEWEVHHFTLNDAPRQPFTNLH